MDRQNILKGFLIIFSFVSFFMLFYISAFAKDDTIEGSIVCVNNDRFGKVNTITKYSSCSGVLVVLGNNSRIYALSGSDEQVREIEQSPQKIKKLKGQINGNERAWIFNISTLTPINEQTAKHEIMGDLYCLVPDDDNENIKAIISNESCDTKKPHAHVVSTKDGEIYTIHGDQSAISALEKKSSRTELVLEGNLKKNGSELIID